MIKKPHHPCAALFIIFLGCATPRHHYYMQNSHQVPLFQEEKEFRFTADLSNGSETNGSNIQAAASLTDKFAIMGSWQMLRNKNSYSVNGVADDHWNGNYVEGAFGYYKKIHKYVVFEVYSGAGYSNQLHVYTGDSVYTRIVNWPFLGYDTVYKSTLVPRGNANLSFTKLFVQPQLGISYGIIDFAVSARLSHLHFINVQNKVHALYPDFNEVEQFRNYKNYFFAEPALTVCAGWNYLKLQFQTGISASLSLHSFRMEDRHFSFGLTFAYAERYSKKRRR